MSNLNYRERIAAKVKEQRQQQPEQPAAAAQKPPAKEKGPIAYYDSFGKGYWTKNSREEWVQWKEGDLRRLLRSRGVSSKMSKDDDLSEVEEALLEIQQKHDVHFAGQLAGYPTGLVEVCSSRVLVTKGPRLVKPEKGKFPTIGNFLATLLNDQKVHFLAWMRSAFAALRAGPPFRPGQVMVLAGPPDCGKSLLQSVITDLLGGRSAKPYRYMIGKTEFNADLFAAEHLFIEDDAASTDLRSRRAFGAVAKTMVVNEVQSCHGKGKTALSLHPFWRLTFSLNCEPEDMMVLPPMDEGIKDKFIMLKASKAHFPFDKEDLSARRGFRQRLHDEMPAFVAWLLGWKVPKALVDMRYGCKSYQNPELLQALECLSPQFQLLQFIDSLEPWGPCSDIWEGTSVDLQTRLCGLDKARQVDKLLTYHSACGAYLGRLAKDKKDRVEKISDAGGVATWRIKKKTD